MSVAGIENKFGPLPSRKDAIDALNRQFPRYVERTSPVLEYALQAVEQGRDVVEHERRAAVGLMITLEGYKQIAEGDSQCNYSFDQIKDRGTFPIGSVSYTGYRHRRNWQLEGMAMEHFLEDINLRLGEQISQGNDEVYERLRQDRAILAAVSQPYHYLHFGERMPDDVRIALEALAISNNPLRRSNLQGQEKMTAEWLEAEKIIGNRITPRRVIWGSRRELRIPT